MDELSKHQVRHGQQMLALLSKKTGLPVKSVVKVLREIEAFKNYYCWVNAEEYLDYLEKTDRECEQRLKKKWQAMVRAVVQAGKYIGCQKVALCQLRRSPKGGQENE